MKTTGTWYVAVLIIAVFDPETGRAVVLNCVAELVFAGPVFKNSIV
jgi:hypothetical protein